MKPKKEKSPSGEVEQSEGGGGVRLSERKDPIDSLVLSRALQGAVMPVGAQKGTPRQIDSRRLAYRLRVDEAFTKAEAGPHGATTWKNISEFMAGAIEQGDFKTLDVFCEAWLRFKHDMKIGQVSNRWIASAIITLQKTMDRAPTSSEIVAEVEKSRKVFVHGPDVEREIHDLKVTAKTVNSFAEAWGLSDKLSLEKRGKKT